MHTGGVKDLKTFTRVLSTRVQEQTGPARITIHESQPTTTQQQACSVLHHTRQLHSALWPLSDASGSDSDELRPHEAPKAQELYNILLKGLPHPPWYMINPNGWPRSLWDFLLAVFTIALLIYVPVLIAFYSNTKECVFFGKDAPAGAAEPNAPAQPASGVRFMTLTNCLFLLDIFLNFLTGVKRINADTGMVEYCYNLPVIAVEYCKSWLLLDVLSCLPLECMVSAGGVVHGYNLGHLNRLLKAYGLRRRAHGDPFRLINRLPMLRRTFNYSLHLVVVSASVLLLGLHYFACALWLVLRVQDFPAATWPVELDLVNRPNAYINVFECWTWSVFAVTSAMIGLGYGSFPPTTFAESVLWTVEMMVMAGGFAVVNGFILSAILESLAAKARYKSKLLQARREVTRRQLSKPLQKRVIAFFALKYRTLNMQDGDAIMSELAPGLRLQVAMASVGKMLSHMPVLAANPQLLQRAALLMKPQVAPEGQLITIPGTPVTQLIFITRGYADLYAGSTLLDTLTAGESIGEAALLPVPPLSHLPPNLSALWSASGFSCHAWPNLCCLRALSSCSLMVLDGTAFAELLGQYEWAEQQLQQLGERHASVLESLPELEQLWKAAAVFDPLSDPAAQPHS